MGLNTEPQETEVSHILIINNSRVFILSLPYCKFPEGNTLARPLCLPFCIGSLKGGMWATVLFLKRKLDLLRGVKGTFQGKEASHSVLVNTALGDGDTCKRPDWPERIVLTPEPPSHTHGSCQSSLSFCLLSMAVHVCGSLSLSNSHFCQHISLKLTGWLTCISQLKRTRPQSMVQ